jgi:ribosomal protein S18 acetylase RimI-like enzyme
MRVGGIGMAQIQFREPLAGDDGFIVAVTRENMARIVWEAWGKPFSENDLLEHIRQSDTTIIEYNAERAGYYTCNWRGKSVHIGSIMIARKFQGKGIGTRALQRIETMARRKGCETVELFVQMNNPRAVALYERLGFVRAGAPYPGTLHMVKPVRGRIRLF